MTDFRTLYGWAELDPAGPVEAGSWGTFALRYHVGQYGMDDGGGLKVAVRFASDWGYPQFAAPAAPNYCRVTSTGAAQLACRFDLKGHIRPFQKCLVIDVSAWALSPGEVITVVYGDTSGGSPGTRVQTFREDTFEFRVLVDPFGTGEYVALEASPCLEIVPAAAAVLRVQAPTQVVVDETFALGLKLEDRWGNPAVGFVGEVRLEGPPGLDGVPGSVHLGPADAGCVRVTDVCWRRPGRGTIAASWGPLQARSNPVEAVAGPLPFRPYWGDLHGQSEETVGTNSIDAYFRFARDVAMVDFVGHQGNDFQVTPEFWQEVNRSTARYHEPGRFITFPGYEWSATTPAGGDHNVYYLHEGEPVYRTSHWQVAADRTGPRRDLADDRYPIDALYAQLHRHQALVVPHIGGRPANLDFHDPELEPVIEIYSAWGQFEWLLRQAMERGYRVGFVAGSDDHKGRPGASYPGSAAFGVYGGMTCILARALTRQALWEALWARRCYATTGQRILLDVRCGPHLMGAEFACGTPVRLQIRAAGTAPVEEVGVYRGLELVQRFPAAMPRDRSRLRVRWGGALIRGRGRIATWDGQLQLQHGRIAAVSPYALDSAAESVTQLDAHTVSWRSVTSGDEDGVVLKLEDAAAAVLSFATPLARFSLPLADLGEAPHVVEVGGVDLRVEVEYLPLGFQSCQVACEFADAAPRRGCQPYYVRLTQTDGARAWSSPMYIHAAG